MDTQAITAIKKLLLETAEALFADNGYSGTSIRDIAKKAGVNVALINYHFKSKENLYLIIFKRRFSAYEQVLLKMDSGASADKKLDSFLEIYGAFIEGHQNFHRLLSREITLLHHPAIKEVITTGTRKNYLLVKNIITEGIQAGIFKNVNVHLVTINIIAFVPRLFSGSPFITDLFESQTHEFKDKQHLSFQIRAYFYSILCSH